MSKLTLALVLVFMFASETRADGLGAWFNAFIQRFNQSTPNGGQCIFHGYAACIDPHQLGGCLPNGGHFYPWSEPMPCAICDGMTKNPYGGGYCTPA